MKETFGLVKELWSLSKPISNVVEFDWEKYILFSLWEKKDMDSIVHHLPEKGFLVAKIRYFTAKHIYEILEIFPEKKNK